MTDFKNKYDLCKKKVWFLIFSIEEIPRSRNWIIFSKKSIYLSNCNVYLQSAVALLNFSNLNENNYNLITLGIVNFSNFVSMAAWIFLLEARIEEISPTDWSPSVTPFIQPKHSAIFHMNSGQIMLRQESHSHGLIQGLSSGHVQFSSSSITPPIKMWYQKTNEWELFS